MEFLYFPEDKSEYIPGIISILVIFLLSILIVRLLLRASRKEVQKLEQQGYPAFYNEAEEAAKKQQGEDATTQQHKADAGDAEIHSDKKP
ncbi:MAG TPA: hypothetical protein VLQ20_09450 [Planococcus sp. (in: firmicutes)]|nr:hypothetical protein [Planococcus sp. (in: firmicutes)]